VEVSIPLIQALKLGVLAERVVEEVSIEFEDCCPFCPIVVPLLLALVEL
jgi:hypothetical protein